MALKELIANEAEIATPHQGVMVRGLAADSRAVRRGYLFAVLSDDPKGGAAYVSRAVERGAVAILTSPRIKLQIPQPANQVSDVAHITAPEPRRLFSLMASRFYPAQYPPSRPPLTIAVTGTNGKTSVAMFTRHIWTRLGYRTASVGTLGVIAGGLNLASPLTTPGADIIHRVLAALARRSYRRVILEASSHGLAQYRLDHVELAAAVFTRLGEDHMDYHQTREDYLNAKLRLIRELLPSGSLVICDEEAPGAMEAKRAARENNHRLLRVGGRGAEIYFKGCEPMVNGQRLTVIYEGKTYEVDFPLVGRFQAVNALLAAASVLGTEPLVESDHIFSALETMPPVPGRLERIGEKGGGGVIYIDYAHTPDALEEVLSALRVSLAGGGRLSLVFGAGGERDQGKRPLMGRVARRLADDIIITDDNPRFEDAARIRRAIARACPGARDIGDRAEAIETAIKQLGARDILLVAGKGHENYLEREGRLVDFSDSRVICDILEGLG